MRVIIQRKQLRRTVIASLLTVIILSMLQFFDWPTTLRNEWFDLLQRYSAPQSTPLDVVVIAVDDKTIHAADEPLSLFHRQIADFLALAVNYKPKAIGFDFVLPTKTFDKIAHRDQPELSFHRYLLQGLLDDGNELPITFAASPDINSAPNNDFLAVVAFVSKRPFGSPKLCVERDGVFRRLRAECESEKMPLLSRQIAAIDEREYGYVDFIDLPRIPVLSLTELFEWKQQSKLSALQSALTGKYVLFGVVTETIDRVITPYPSQPSSNNNETSGVQIQALILHNLITHKLIIERTTTEFLLGIAFVFFLIGHTSKRKLFIFSATLAAIFAASLVLYQRQIFLPPIWPLMVGLIAFLVRAIIDAISIYEQKKKLRAIFSGYVSPTLLSSLDSGDFSLGLHGRVFRTAVVFSDIRGFTTISEKLNPEQVVDLLNTYFDEMVDCVHQFQGTVDKFMGDGMMFFYGAPIEIATPAIPAFDSIMMMSRRLDIVNEKLLAKGLPEIDIGFGLHIGNVVVGNIGAQARHSYTAIGDTVNIAARLEGLCKLLNTTLVVSSEAYATLTVPQQLKLTLAGEQEIRGRTSIVVYRL